MGYIKSSEEKPFVLSDFCDGTKFRVRSDSNNCKICNVLLERFEPDDQSTTVEVTVWGSVRVFGRHVLEIDEAADRIDMREFLREVSLKFAQQDFSKTECYIESSFATEKGKVERTF